jgi:hypothetical protein
VANFSQDELKNKFMEALDVAKIPRSEFANLLKISYDTLKSYTAGRLPVPPRVVAKAIRFSEYLKECFEFCAEHLR